MGMEQYKKKDEALFAAVSRVKSGDASAWSEMYELSSKYLYKIIYDIVKDTTTTEDLLQETYLQIYNKIDTLQEAGAFYVWAGRIATNYTLRYLQKYRKEVLVTADDEGNTDYAFENASEDNELFIPETVMQDAETHRLMAEILDALPVAQKLTIQYYYYEEMSVHDIAEAMDTTDGTVKSRLNYARKAIKDAVLDLEKNKDTKLYSLASLPLFYLFFRESIAEFFAEGSAAAASVATATTKAVEAANSSATAATTSTAVSPASADAVASATEPVAPIAEPVASAAKTSFFATTVGKVVIGVIAVAVVAGGIGIAVGVKNANASKSKPSFELPTQGLSYPDPTVNETEEPTEQLSEEEQFVADVRAVIQPQYYVEKYGCYIVEEYSSNGVLKETTYFLPGEVVKQTEAGVSYYCDSYYYEFIADEKEVSEGPIGDKVSQGDGQYQVNYIGTICKQYVEGDSASNMYTALVERNNDSLVPAGEIVNLNKGSDLITFDMNRYASSVDTGETMLMCTDYYKLSANYELMECSYLEDDTYSFYFDSGAKKRCTDKIEEVKAYINRAKDLGLATPLN